MSGSPWSLDPRYSTFFNMSPATRQRDTSQKFKLTEGIVEPAAPEESRKKKPPSNAGPSLGSAGLPGTQSGPAPGTVGGGNPSVGTALIPGLSGTPSGPSPEPPRLVPIKLAKGTNRVAKPKMKSKYRMGML